MNNTLGKINSKTEVGNQHR